MFTTRREFLGATAASAALLAASCTQTPAAGSGDAKLNELLDRISTEALHEAPEYATILAVTEAQAGGRYIDRLSDVSKAGKARQLDMGKQALTDLQAISRDSLSKAAQVSYDVALTSIQNQVETGSYDPGGGATGPYVLTQLTGSYTQSPDFLSSQHPVTDRGQADAYLTRLSLFAKQMDQEIAVLNADVANGVVPPDFCIQRNAESGETSANGKKGAIPQMQIFISKPAAQNILVTSFQQRLNGVQSISASDKTALLQHAETIVHDEVYPAYQRQIDALKAVLPHATHDAGVWKLPRGQEMYASALKAQTTTSMTPDEIHQMGLELIQSLTGQVDAILRSQGMTRGSVTERIGQLNKDRNQLYTNDDAGREQLLAELNRQVQAVRARMGEVCGVLAKADLQIKRVPEFTQDGAPGGYYNPAAVDGSRPGTYYINLRDTAEWPKFTLPTLTYHEGIPGHHWQISIAQESGSLPFFRSKLSFFVAYAEGWGLYAEQLADEMGFYANDPLGKVGYLQSAAFRASRLVCDTGIHSKRWTREQAIQSMVDATGQARSSVITEIERYCVWPGQATGYMVGRQALNKMRQSAKDALGASFDIKGFHDTVLTNGATPLSVTESLVNDWVASKQHA